MILIVDDSAFSRKATRKIFERLGHPVAEADGVSQALSMLAEQDYQFVLTDLLMPELDGFDLLAKVDQVRRVPVAVLTCDVQHSNVQRCMDLGAVAVIHKPVDEAKLAEVIELVLAAR